MDGQPPAVAEFSDALVRAVDKALGMKLDHTPDTLPFLDHYLKHSKSSTEDRDERGDVKPEFLQLIAPMAGCYFGEVVRRSFETRWVTPGEDPSKWRMEFCRCFMFFSPMGVVVESLLQREVEGIPGAFQVAADQREHVAALLENQPAILERHFFALTVRWEILDLVNSHLMEHMLLGGEPHDIVPEQ
ncbi:MAG: hypothetical protein JRG91_13465, partial [Deltaproteobacteria bacterium]|nr:hypothetical protein [Deltaproteobacteria bacterium]